MDPDVYTQTSAFRIRAHAIFYAKLLPFYNGEFAKYWSGLHSVFKFSSKVQVPIKDQPAPKRDWLLGLMLTRPSHRRGRLQTSLYQYLTCTIP